MSKKNKKKTLKQIKQTVVVNQQWLSTVPTLYQTILDIIETGGTTDEQVRAINITDYNITDGYINRLVQWYIDSPDQTLTSTNYVNQKISELAGNCWSQGLMDGSNEYLPHQILNTGIYNGHNMTAITIHTNGGVVSPYSALMCFGATNLNTGLNLSAIFNDNTDGSQTPIPVLYNNNEIATTADTATTLTQAKQYTNSLVLLPNYNSKSTLTIQPNSSLTPTTSCFVCWVDASFEISINGSYALPPGMYPVLANSTVNNNGESGATIAIYQAININ